MPRIRAAEAADVPQIVELVRQGLTADLLGCTIFGCHGIGAYIEDVIRRSGIPLGSRFIVHTQRDKVLGFAQMRWTCDELFLNQIHVRPDSQKQGIGNGLLSEAIQRTRSRQQPTIGLDVFAQNRVARRWYQSIGFLAQEERVWITLPLTGAEAGMDRSWFAARLAEADRVHSAFGFSEFSLTTPRRTYRVGRLGDDLFRTSDARLPQDQLAVAALATIDPSRDALGIFDAHAAEELGFEGSHVKARSIRMSASVEDVLDRLAAS